MTTRKTLLNCGAAILALALAGPLAAESIKQIRVVATFSILGDMVSRIGGEYVAVTTLVGPNSDAHVFQPTPAHARAVSEAQMLIVNGLEFEGWLERLIHAASFNGIRVVATDGIVPITFEKEKDHHAGDKHADDEKHGKDEEHDEVEDKEHAQSNEPDHHDHGASDPHAWQSLSLAIIYVDNITAALAKADPVHAAHFYQNRADYVAAIKVLDTEIHEIVASLPKSRRTVVTSHDAFQYFGRDYGLSFLAPQGLSTESEASAQDVARLIKQMRDKGISAVFLENITDTRLLKQIANEAGATIGGTLFPDALTGEDGAAPTYLEMMRHNATTLARALTR